MKVILKNNVSKFLIMVGLGSFLCSVLAYVVTIVVTVNVNDVMFFAGILLTMGAILSMIEGKPIGAESYNHPEAPFISNENIDVAKLDNEKLLTSIYIIDRVKNTLISSEFLMVGIITLIISYII